MSSAELSMKALEQHWRLALPKSFYRLYEAFELPFISPCEFLDPDVILNDTERWRGMLPQFLPFGHDGADDFYGFYIPANSVGSNFPVLFWNHEYDHYYPIASGFEAAMY